MLATCTKPTLPLDIRELSRDNNLLKLEVIVEQADYRQKFDEELRNLRRKIHLPGFRAGQVPASLVKKQYGFAVLYDTVSKDALKNVVEYVEDYNLRTLGMPILDHTDISPEQVGERNYSFVFHIALLPEIHFDFDKLPTVPSYKVQISDEDVQEALHTASLKKGERASVGIISQDLEYEIEAWFYEVDEAGSQLVDGASVDIRFMTSHYKATHALLVGKQVGDKLPITFGQFFQADTLGEKVLQVGPSTYQELKNKPLHLEVKGIQAITPLDLDSPDVWQQLLRGYTPESKEDFVQKYKEKLQEAYDQMAAERGEFELHKSLLENHPFDLPLEHVEKLVMNQMEGVESVEQLYEKNPGFYHQMKMYVLQQRLLEAFPDLKVSDDDVQQKASEEVKRYFGDMGMLGGPGATAEATKHEHTEDCDHSHEEGHVHDENCSHHHHHHHEADDTDGVADVDVQQAAISSLVQHLMSDKKYREQAENNLQSERLIGFLRSKLRADEKVLNKAAFDLL